MATLVRHIDKYDDPPDMPLKLSIRWQRIWMEWHGDVEALLDIGLFLGDQPMLAPAAYDHPRGYDNDWLRTGCFAGEDFTCSLLDELWKTLTTGERIDWEDISDPTFRLVIAPDIFQTTPRETTCDDFYDILVVIQHGGPWHAAAMGLSGPALVMTTIKADLERFFYALLDEALDPAASGKESREYLSAHFKYALAIREER